MPSFPDFKGRNPSGNELPKVTGGDSLRPRDINRLSTGIDRTTLRTTVGGGFRIKRSDGGTTITAKDNVSQYHWRCTKDNNHIHINIGDVWGLGVVNRAKKQILTNVNYDAISPEAKRYYQGCPDVMIGVDNATHIAASKIPVNEKLYVPALKGVYYIKYTTWTGQSSSSATPQDSAITALKGTLQVCLLFSETPSLIQNDPYVYPVCEIDDDGLLWQGVDSPIFINRASQHEWKVDLIPTSTEFRVVVTRATICNVVPKYNGTAYELGSTNPSAFLTISGGTSPSDGVYAVLLECEADASSYLVHFPKTAVVKIQKDYNPYTNPDTATKAYLRLADIVFTTDSGTGMQSVQVYQYLRSSLWAERQKWNDGLQYFYYQMNAT